MEAQKHTMNTEGKFRLWLGWRHTGRSESYLTQEQIIRNYKADLIEAALVELGHVDCPYCGCNIKLDNYVSRQDIENWLKEKEDK